jgi:RNA-splicing ligase RtcB
MDVLEIKGKVNTALCYAKVVEDEAIEQIHRMCDHDFTEGSQIRIMPDVHSGKGCTIGTTMTIKDKAVPNIVGVDIGCGMYTVNIGKGDIDFEKLDAAAHFIPSGKTDENRPSDGKRQIIHKNFTETSQIPLDFSAGMGYAMLALKQKEC